jgi:hypothetical protein
MKKLMHLVVVWSVVAVLATPALCVTDMGEISCGQTLGGSIDVAAQMDRWTFYGQAGDRALIAVKRTSGSLYPYMVWYAPDGSEEAAGYRFVNQELSQTGTYTVVVYDGDTGYGDTSLDDTGAYNITFLNLQGCSWGSISCDETQSGSIDAPSDMEAVQFEGQAGDRVLIAVKRTSGSLYPYMVWYAPDGSQEAAGYRYVNQELSQTGTYTVVVYDGDTGYGDLSLDDTGGYNMTFLNLQGCSWGSISCDETQSGSIDAPSDMEVVQFEGQAGDRMLIALKGTSGALYPYMVWYAPDGSEETAGYQLLDQELSQTGTYTVVVYDGDTGYGDLSLDDTGDYSISLTCLPPPPESPDLVVSSLDVSPNPVLTGETATVSWTVENAGILAATPTGYWLEVRLSDDTIYDGSDTLIGQTQITEVLEPDGETSGTYALGTAGLAEGIHYIVAMVDTAGIVDEGSEANNTASTLVIVSGEDCDLTISSTEGGEVTTPGEGTFVNECGSRVPVVAEPDAGYKFAFWDGTAVEAEKVDDPLSADTTVTVDANYDLRANFVINEVVPPEVMTEPAEDITCTSAWIAATLVYDGGEDCECRFRYWEEGDSTNYRWCGSASSGVYFGSSLGNLTPGRTYYYVADASNSAGSASGEILSFTTAVRLTISATAGGTVVEPDAPVVELPTAGEVAVVAEADQDYLFWHWQGTAAEAGKVTPDVTSANARVLVDADDTLIATFLKRDGDASDRNPAPCRGAEGSTSQYWGFDGEGDSPPANVYELTGVPKNGLPPLPGTSLEPDESAGGEEQWWPVDDQPGSERTGLLVLPAMRVSTNISPSADTATTVWVQCVWRPYDEGEEGAAEPLLLDPEPAPLDPPLLTQEISLGDGWRHGTYVWTVAPSPGTVAFTLAGRIVVDALIVDTCTESLGIIHVDDDAPLDPGPNDMAISDPLEDGTAEHPFDSIQEGIDVAIEGAMVLVHAGRYSETIDLSGKGITVTAEWLWDSSISAASVLDAGGAGPAVQFVGPEETPSVLSGLTITGARALTEPAIVCDRASPLISHCLIAGNMATAPGGVVIACQDSQARFVNCTVSGNRAGPDGAVLSFADSEATVVNSIVWGNEGSSLTVGHGATPGILYSDVAGDWSGPGIIDLNPSFARPGSWRSNGTEDPSDDTWVEGDYHLQSQYGRLDSEIEAWVLDVVTSPCIDAGDPQSMSGRELEPNGGRANLGMYGATQQASKSPASDL